MRGLKWTARGVCATTAHMDPEPEPETLITRQVLALQARNDLHADHAACTTLYELALEFIMEKGTPRTWPPWLWCMLLRCHNHAYWKSIAVKHNVIKGERRAAKPKSGRKSAMATARHW